MASVDLVTTKKEQAVHEKELIREVRKRKADEEASTSFQTVELESSTSSHDERVSSEQDEEKHSTSGVLEKKLKGLKTL